MMKIEFLYFDGCPSHEKALADLREFLREEGDDSPIDIIPVETQVVAEERQFVGSPTIRFMGEDLVPPLPDQGFALGCRVYMTPDGPKGLPPRELLERAYRKATSR